MNLVLAAVIGGLAGLHVATWGMYKDGPHEGFAWRKYWRSPIVGALAGIGAQIVVGWNLAGDPAARVVAWGTCYVLERAACEFWKYFVREEDQSKYFIPMQFGILGRPMKNAPLRIAIGVAIAAGCVLAFSGIVRLEASYGDAMPTWLVVVTVGSVFGWISAFGGAWKDAPIEGFETLKFFRSPGIAVTFAAMLSLLTTSWPLLALAAEGFTVAAIETHKKFGEPAKPPGKFAGKPIAFPEHVAFRRPFRVVYFAIWALVIGHLAWALAVR